MDYNLIYKKAEGYVTGLFEKLQNGKIRADLQPGVITRNRVRSMVKLAGK